MHHVPTQQDVNPAVGRYPSAARCAIISAGRHLDNFIKGLPKVHWKSVILAVINHFSHFIVLSHSYTKSLVFFESVVRLHGFPTSIVNDHNSVFTSHMWHNLLSTTLHNQTNDQSKVVNKVIAMYFCCATGDRPHTWVDCLPWA